MSAKKPPTTNKVFAAVAKELGFQGSGATWYMELPTYFLLINHQKSVYSKLFYVNVGMFYKELLKAPLSEDELLSAFRIHAPVLRHVDFRIEKCPGMPPDLAEQIDKCVQESRIHDLTDVLRDALMRLLAFMEKSHDRKTIRQLSNAKQLAAMLLKEV